MAVEGITDNWEILLVDDGSTDGSWEVIQQLEIRYPQVKGIRLTKNGGQYQAIQAGLEQVRGEWVVVMDSDGQDRPEEIPGLYQKSQQGYHIVFALRQRKAYPLSKIILSRVFHLALSFWTFTRQDHRIAGFGIYKTWVIRRQSRLAKGIFYLPAMQQWRSYITTTHPVHHAPRTQGNTKYNFSKQLQLGLKVFKSYGRKA